MTSTMNPGQNDSAKTVEADSIDQLLEDLNGTNTLPLWEQMAKLNTPEPNPQCVPHIWRYEETKPYLLRAGELVTEQQAERRVLMLINPKRGEIDSERFVIDEAKAGQKPRTPQILCTPVSNS